MLISYFFNMSNTQHKTTAALIGSLDYQDKALLYCIKNNILPYLRESLASNSTNVNQKTIQKLITLNLIGYSFEEKTYYLTLRGRIVTLRSEFSIPLHVYLSTQLASNRLYMQEKLPNIKEGSPPYDMMRMADFYIRNNDNPSFPLFFLKQRYGERALALANYAMSLTNLVLVFNWLDSNAQGKTEELISHILVTEVGRKLI